jgi:hypothetical protein
MIWGQPRRARLIATLFTPPAHAAVLNWNDFLGLTSETIL